MGILDAPAADFRRSPMARFDPSRDVPNLLGWFDPDQLTGSNGAEVSRWPAAFGGFSLNNFSTGKPTVLTNAQNGRRAVRFAAGAKLTNTDAFGSSGLGLSGPVGAPLMHAFVFRFSADYAVSGNVIMLQHGNMRVRYVLAGRTLYLTATNGEAPNGPELNDGQWHVAVIAFGPSGASCYIDGYLTSILAAPGAVTTATAYEVGPGIGGTVTAGNLDLGDLITAQIAPKPEYIQSLTQALADRWAI